MDKNINLLTLARAAKDKAIYGVGAYQVGITGETHLLRLFLDTFANELIMEYPCYDYCGVSLNDGEEGIKLKALIDQDGKTISVSDLRMMDFVQEALNERVWSVGTSIAIGRR